MASAAGRTVSTAASTTDDEVHRLHVEAELAGDDARHVEHVVDQPRLRLRVALDRLERAGRVSLVAGCPVRSIRVQPRIALSGVRSSCESVRQELVLGPAGLLGFFARLLLAGQQLFPLLKAL